MKVASIEYGLLVPKFTASEAERITGISGMTQRDWKRRGIVLAPGGGGGGHSRFDPFHLLQLWAFGIFASRGIGPSQTKGHVGAIAVDTLRHILRRKEAYAGAHEFALEWLPETTLEKLRSGPRVPETWPEYARSYGLDPDMTKFDWMWAARANWLAHGVFKALGDPSDYDASGDISIPWRYFVWAADGSTHNSVDLDETFEAFKQEGRGGATVVLDLATFATLFLQRLGHPLVEVKFHVELELPAERPSRRKWTPQIVPGAELIAHGHLLENEGRWT